MKKQSRTKAFTLLELLIVIAIVGILTLISIPAFRNFQTNFKLSSVSREMITNVRYIQQLAITEQIEYCIIFFTTEKKYQLLKCDGESILKEIVLPLEISNLSVSGLTNNEVRYNPYGAVQEEGSIILENINGKVKTILIRASGFVKISD